jgi:hypothetical protein
VTYSNNKMWAGEALQLSEGFLQTFAKRSISEIGILPPLWTRHPLLVTSSSDVLGSPPKSRTHGTQYTR